MKKKLLILLFVIVVASCDNDGFDTLYDVYQEQFLYWTNKSIESTDAFIRVERSNDLDSMNYYVGQGSAYKECASHYYKLMHLNK